MLANGQKRAFEPLNPLVISDHNAWYYPSQGYDSEGDQLPASVHGGNWGKKTTKGARWVRRGKIAAWGPEMDDWEMEERARKRLKFLFPPEERSPSPPTLPHLRSPSPPLLAPYPVPVSQHLSFSSFVMDKSVTHSFRSGLLDELEEATHSLIEGEAAFRRTLGRLWQVINEGPEKTPEEATLVLKQEEEDHAGEEDEEDEHERRLARAPDLTPAAHRLFLVAFPDGNPSVVEPSQFASPEVQQDSLAKCLATLRELQDDGREYMERLVEIREGVGETRAQRNIVWEMVREKAVKELQDAAASASTL